jgi:ankyrin repeat protein
VIPQLLSAKCDVHAQARDGNNALHLASLGGSLAAVQALVQEGVDPIATNEEGQTPLQVATLFRNREWRAVAQVLQNAQVHPPQATTTSRHSRQRHFDRFALQITLVCGEQLKALDLFADSDPYCACCISNPPGFVRSKTIPSAASPEWNQILMLRINLVPQYLRVEVWDDDFGKTKDDFIGAGTVSLSQLVADTKQRLEALPLEGGGGEDPDLPETDLWLEIHAGGRFTGKVRLKVKIRKMKPLTLF